MCKNINKIIFICDAFLEHCVGGGELNNEELIEILISKDYNVEKIQSHLVSIDFLKKNKNCFFIIGNFAFLSHECKEHCQELRYIIYEHDHKYLKSRNPALHKNFKIPKSEIINFNFYKNAIAVLCQSEFHKNIVEKNLKLDNIISVGGNLWSIDVLEKIRDFSKKEKRERCSIMQSNISHKNTYGAIQYCKNKKLDYELIPSCTYYDFLDRISSNKTLVFIPQTPETLSRIIVEARMMGMSVMVNGLVGASGEEWFALKGGELIDFMIEKREEVAKLIESFFDKEGNKASKKISILSTFHEGEKYLEHFLEDITRQTIFKDCELIIVDAKSSGKEKEIIEKYIKKYDNIIYHRIEEKLKPTICLNMAIQMSNAKYLTFGLIDDRKRKDCLEILYNNLIDDVAVDLVYGDCLVTSNINETFENNTSNNSLFDHSRLPFSNKNMIKCLPGPMPLWKKDIHDKCGFFDEDNCNFADDWEMWLRAVHSGSKFKKVNKIVGLYLTGGRSQQENNLEQRKEEAKIFYKYSYIFGENFIKFKSYFDQFIN